MKKIFIAEIIPSGNKGEATLMHGIKETITSTYPGKVMFFLCSASIANDSKEYGNDVFVINHPGLTPHKGNSKQRIIYFIKEFSSHLLFFIAYKLIGINVKFIFKNDLWRAYLESDVILIGHDNAFSKFHLPLIFFCLLLKKKITVYGTTIMPNVLNSTIAKKAATFFLNKVDLITTREAITYKFLKSDLGIDKAPLYCTADKAFILRPASREKADRIIKEEKIPANGKPLVGVMMVRGSNVFKAAFRGENLSDEEKYHKHNEEIAKALDTISKEIDCYIVFLPHSIGPAEDIDDRIVARSIKNYMKNNKHVILIEKDLSPQALKALMGKCHMTISERTHGGIASATMEVPTLWISHPNDSRTYGIVGGTLEMEDCLYNIEELNSQTLTKKILWLWNDKEKISTRLSKSIKKAKALTMENGVHFKNHLLDV